LRTPLTCHFTLWGDCAIKWSSSLLDYSADVPINVALVNDYEIVLAGLAAMLQPFEDRITVCELDAMATPREPVHIALLSSFSLADNLTTNIKALLESDHIDRVVLFTWNFEPDMVDTVMELGVSGYLSKAMTASELADAITRVYNGELVVAAPPGEADENGVECDWPGRQAGLTERESEILALIGKGHPNADIAAALFLSLNSVKTHIRRIYDKIGVDSRTRAVLWALDNGFRPRPAVRQSSGNPSH
jgi:DNA-binding NarL/FixJ family response regulator